MAVPVPIEISINPPPTGWTAQDPNRFQKLVQLIASLLSGQIINASFLTGQVGGAQPTHDIGPWATYSADINGYEWRFWDPALGSYQPSEQGCPVGTVAIWPTSLAAPPRWLVCSGQDAPISTYSRLYNAIGHTWGGSGANFKLPPGKGFYLNAPNFSPMGAADYTQSLDGLVNVRGGKQVETLTAKNLPALKISIPYVNNSIVSGGGNNVPDATAPSGPGYSYPVTDENGNPVGTNQQPIPILPPFVIVHYIIKYV